MADQQKVEFLAGLVVVDQLLEVEEQRLTVAAEAATAAGHTLVAVHIRPELAVVAGMDLERLVFEQVALQDHVRAASREPAHIDWMVPL